MADQGEIVRISLHYSIPGASDVLNVFFGEVAGSISDSALLDAIADWAELDWAPDWADMASADAQLVNFDADIVLNTGHVDRNLGGGLVGVSGTIASEVLPSGVAAYLLAYTAFPKSRGSKYVPGLTEGSVVDGIISPALLVELAILLLRFISFDGTALAEFLVAGVLARVAEEFRAFSGGGAITDVPAYQRRRKPNVGS